MFQAPQTTFAPQRPDSAQRQRIATILEKVAAMLECFPDRADAPSGMAQAETIAQIFAGYPDEVVDLLTNPVSGMPVRQKWRPTPFDVKQACEEAFAPVRARLDRQRREAETRALLAAPVLPRSERPTLEELQQRNGGPSWGISHSSAKREEKPVKSLAELEAERDSFVVEDSPELKAAIQRILSEP